MRFTFTDVMTRSEYLPDLAVAAEAAGYHGFTIPDSIGYPEHSDAIYPYTAEGDRSFLEGKEFIEPFVLAASLGAITATNQVQHLRGEISVPRAGVGGKAGIFGREDHREPSRSRHRHRHESVPDDYLMAGVDPAHKGARMDEAIEVFRGLGSGEYFEFHGRFYDVPALKLCPVPTEPVPLLIGGHSDAALYRAATKGDGWMHAGGPNDVLEAMVQKLAALRREAGTADRPFEIHAVSPDARTVDGCKRLENLGVTDVLVGFRNPYINGEDAQPLQDKLARLRRYAEDVIGKVNP